MLTIRFDMRAPAWAAPAADLYAAAIDMCAWVETRGALVAVLSEHHGAADGHLPAPTILASAIASRTTSLAILLAAVPITLWDPVRLAEEIAVLDLVSGGRVSYVFGIGHRREEYEHFGVDWDSRGRLADDNLATVRGLLRGESPLVMVAGGSRPAARRAARHGLGFISQTAEAGLKDYYDAQCRAHGHPPGVVQMPASNAPTVLFVADDIDRGWHELGSYLLHDAVTAASYRHGDDSVASITRAQTVADLRAAGGPYRIVTAEQGADYVRGGRPLPLHPLCGGLPPDIAWRYLEFAVACANQSATHTKE